MAYQPKSYKKFVATAATATLVATAIVPVASAADAKSFTDVSTNYKEAVDYLVANGIANGKTETTFGTTQNITRGDAAVMIANALDLDTTAAPSAGFKDVNDRVKGAVNAIVAAGIASGKTETKFDPSANITRQEMAKMLANAYGLTAKSNANFKDVNSNWIGYVSALKDNGITLGKTETTFAPTASLTRGEFALFMFRADGLSSVSAAVESVSAINNTTVEVTFKEAIEDVKTLEFAIEGLTVSNAVVKQTGGNKTVVLTTTAQKADEVYTVNLDGKKIGSFKGVSAVIPTAIKVTTASVQAVIGNKTAVSAQVTVPDGQSKAGIPVTFNINNSNPNLNAKIEEVRYTNAEGVATYEYQTPRYYDGVDNVAAYATSKSTVVSYGTVYWASALQLTIKDVTGVNSLANNDSKVYEINSAKNANKYVFVAFKENLNQTADKVVRSVVAKGSSTHYLTNANTISSVAEYPYEITTGSKAVIAVKLDQNGKSNLVLTGTNATVTPIVYEGVAVDGADADNIAGNALTEFTNAAYNAQTLQAEATALTFEAKHVLGLTIEAQGVANAATYKGTKETGGRDYTVTYVDKDGKPAKAGSPVQIAIPVQTASDNVFLLNADGTKDLGIKIGDNRVFSKTVAGNEGKIAFTVVSDLVTQFVEPTVYVDNGTGVGAKAGLDATDLQAKGAVTHFTDAVTYATSLKLVDAKGNAIKSVLANGIEKAFFQYATVDQNGKARAYRLMDGTTAPTTLTYTVHAGTSPLTVVNGVGTSNVVSAGGTGTFNVVIPGGQSSGALEVISTLPTTATVSATATVAGLVLGTTDAVTASFVNTSVVNVTGTVTDVNKASGIVAIDGIPYDLSDATYLNGGTAVPTLAAFYDHLTVGKTVSVTKDKDGKLVFNVTGAGLAGAVDAVNSATTPGQLLGALKSYPGFSALPVAIQTRIANTLPTGTLYTTTTLDTAYEVAYKAAVTAEITTVVVPAATTAATGTQAQYTAFVDTVKGITGSATVVTNLNAVTNATTQKAIASSVAGITTPTTGTAAENAAAYLVLVQNAINVATAAETVQPTVDALADLNGAADGPELLIALNKLNTTATTKTNAAVLGLDLTKLTSTNEVAVTAQLFATKAPGFTALNIGTKFASALDFVADATAPTVKTAVYDDVAQTITVTFSEAITFTGGTLDKVDLKIGATTAVAGVKAVATADGLVIHLDASGYGDAKAAGYVVAETITINAFQTSTGTAITVNDISAAANAYVAASFTATLKK